MLKCWSYRPGDRPSFAELSKLLWKLEHEGNTYVNIEPLLESLPLPAAGEGKTFFIYFRFISVRYPNWYLFIFNYSSLLMCLFLYLLMTNVDDGNARDVEQVNISWSVDSPDSFFDIQADGQPVSRPTKLDCYSVRQLIRQLIRIQLSFVLPCHILKLLSSFWRKLSPKHPLIL